MTIKEKKTKSSRHIPAYILLFLARDSLYGAALLSLMQKELPFFLVDSAIIYRTMQSLEKDGLVQSYWETDISGPARKWYKITEDGLKRLFEYKQDIVMRKKNLEFFLAELDKIDTSGKLN